MKRIMTAILTILLAASAATAGVIKLPPITDKNLENHLEVVIIENHELPVVNINLVISAGSLYDPPGKEGLSNFTANIINKGTKSRTASQIAEEIDFVGASLSGSADRDAIYIRANALVRHFETVLDILADIVLNPTFSDEEFERTRKKTLSEIVQAKEEPSIICARAFDSMLFDSHPYGHPIVGTKEALEKMTANDVKNFYGTYFKSNNSFLVIAGDIDPDEAMSRIGKAFRSWKSGAIPALSMTSPAAVEGRNILLIDKPDATQTYIRFGNFGITRESDDYYAFNVMNYILGAGVSFINRLMKQVRDEAGLTYDIRTVNEFNTLPGAFYCNTFTENDSTLKAINASLAIMKDMADNPVSDEEYKNAISFYTGYYPTTLETPAQVAREIVRLKLANLPFSYMSDFTKNISKVKKDDIQKIARRLIDTENLDFVVVSKATDVEDKLKTLGPVTVKSLDDF